MPFKWIPLDSAGHGDGCQSREELEKAGKTVYKVGSLVEREGEGCILKNLDAWD